MKGYVVRPAKPTVQKRNNAWDSAKRWGVVVKHFYFDVDEAKHDAKVATELTGIRFEVVDAEGI